MVHVNHLTHQYKDFMHSVMLRSIRWSLGGICPLEFYGLSPSRCRTATWAVSGHHYILPQEGGYLLLPRISVSLATIFLQECEQTRLEHHLHSWLTRTQLSLCLHQPVKLQLYIPVWPDWWSAEEVQSGRLYKPTADRAPLTASVLGSHCHLWGSVITQFNDVILLRRLY